MDRILLNGIECRCRVGVPEAERRTRQKVVVDVTVEVDVTRAGIRDDFRETVDYQGLERHIRQSVEAREVALVETLAVGVSQAVLDFDGRIRSVKVAVHKTPKSMPKTREVAVEIERRRQ